MNDLTQTVYRTRYKEKNTIPDGRLLVFLTGFFLGLVFFYFAGKQLIEESGFLSEETIEALKGFRMEEKGYLFYIMGIRIKQLLFLVFCTLSAWAGVLLYALLGWSGFTLGIFVFGAVYRYGIKGSFYCIFMLLPQGIFYLLLLLHLLNKKTQSGKRYYYKLKDILFVLAMACCGILSECYINPWLMKWLLLFF